MKNSKKFLKATSIISIVFAFVLLGVGIYTFLTLINNVTFEDKDIIIAGVFIEVLAIFSLLSGISGLVSLKNKKFAFNVRFSVMSLLLSALLCVHGVYSNSIALFFGVELISANWAVSILHIASSLTFKKHK